MNRLFILLLAIALCCLPSCSVYMAAKQPGKKDLSVLKKGTQRPRVISELGAPLHTEKKSGRYSDTYSIVQGYSGATKAGRAVFHGAADLFTAGLWEAIGTPTEGAFDGTPVKVLVKYDGNDRVSNVEAFEGRDIVNKAISPTSR